MLKEVRLVAMLAGALVRVFWQPASSLIWWAGPRIYHKWRVYRLPCATYVAVFIAIFCKTLVRAIRVYFCSYYFHGAIMHGFLIDGHICIHVVTPILIAC